MMDPCRGTGSGIGMIFGLLVVLVGQNRGEMALRDWMDLLELIRLAKDEIQRKYSRQSQLGDW